MAGKVSKASVRYRLGTPARHCGNCAMYRPGKDERRGLCTLVEGMIDAKDVCNRWLTKTK